MRRPTARTRRSVGASSNKGAGSPLVRLHHWLDDSLDAAITEWEATFSAALLAEDHSRKYGDSVHGLNINFPPSLSQYNSVSYPWEGQFVYTQVGLDLVAESSWNDCLMAYYGSH